MQSISPIKYDLVLIGGGHSHAIVLKLWGMNPIEGVRLTLISDVTHTPYSGMLPGHIAGFYTYDQTHIDLRRLARFAQAQFYLDQAIGLDLDQNKVICKDHPPVAFDTLSIDIGSTPKIPLSPELSHLVVPAKPVPQFLQSWHKIITQAENHPHSTLSLTIVGGGAGGVELALNMHTRLSKIISVNNLTINLIHKGNELLQNHNYWVSQSLQKNLIQKGINLYLQEEVIQVNKAHQITCQSGLTLHSDHIFWVTQASAPSWIKESGLSVDQKGFILVKDTLQSCSHSHIFAAGDIATIENYSRPKAGVFAVRQGQPLFENLQNLILGNSLKNYHPQKYYLALIGTGEKKAVASWGCLAWESSLLWKWKDHIDRKFMQRFDNFSVMNPHSKTAKNKNSSGQNVMRCSGCGSKIGSSILSNVLNRLNLATDDKIKVGLNQADDAAIFSIPSDQLLVQTVDFFSTIVNDPFIFGKITAHHCLSDLLAMGANPHSALAMVTLPYGNHKTTEEILYQLLSGAMKVLEQSQINLIGGHTTEGKELSFGLTCNGLVSPQQILTKTGLKASQVLVLTKPLGTGILFAAEKQYQAKGRWIDQAIDSMLISNQKASNIFQEFGVTACTDVTGFGLLGHLREMIQNTDVQVQLNLNQIPILQGTIEMVQKGIVSSLSEQNQWIESQIETSEMIKQNPRYAILFDPQTSGGLLASIDLDKAQLCLEKLQKAGYSASAIIGTVIQPENINKPILIED